ncbi:hypothetical protein [Winogradskyella sp.]|uniref:hypothetical protein n=1 Tax=Winogradskyella sp. TaxID=1883156 RepID=UPI0025D05AE3|nr:hypothetical protein [Winogradskyella sp.]
MKFVFSFILITHGFIHLLGFAKAFLLTDLSKQVLGISKPIGSLWLITFILFVVSTSQFLNNKKWFYLGLISVFISQALIIMAWKDAKLGTIPNLIILLVGISAYGKYRLQKMVDIESKENAESQ